MRILVVDDDLAVRRSIDRALRLEGYDVATVPSGGEALEELAQVPPDALVLDLGLPDLDGLTVCRRMRAAGDDTPVLILTARDAVDDRVQGLDAGADDYLVKPFALAELLERLAPGGHGRHVIALEAQGTVDRPADGEVVVHHQDAHESRLRRRPRGPGTRACGPGHGAVPNL